MHRNLAFLVVILSVLLCVGARNVFRIPPVRNQRITLNEENIHPRITIPSQEILDVPTKVPGTSPVEICSLSPAEDLVDIKYINITPNPPQAGKNLTIDAVGVLKVDIEEGSYATFEVKYGFVKLLTGTADLCEKAADVDLQCPLQRGEVRVQKTVTLPGQIPPVMCLRPGGG
jgi:ML domain